MVDWEQHLQRGRREDEAGGEALREFVFEVPNAEAADGPGERVVVRSAVGDASSDFYETGQVLWPASPLLCYFLLSPLGRALLEAAPTVLELGAGLGIPGLLAARICPHVVLTDHNPAVLELLEKNIALNAPLLADEGRGVSVQQLDWSAPDGAQVRPAPHPDLTVLGTAPPRIAPHPPRPDRAAPLPVPQRARVVLGADVAYSEAAVDALFDTVHRSPPYRPPLPRPLPRPLTRGAARARTPPSLLY